MSPEMQLALTALALLSAVVSFLTNRAQNRDKVEGQIKLSEAKRIADEARAEQDKQIAQVKIQAQTAKDNSDIQAAYIAQMQEALEQKKTTEDHTEAIKENTKATKEASENLIKSFDTVGKKVEGVWGNINSI